MDETARIPAGRSPGAAPLKSVGPGRLEVWYLCENTRDSADQLQSASTSLAPNRGRVSREVFRYSLSIAVRSACRSSQSRVAGTLSQPDTYSRTFSADEFGACAASPDDVCRNLRGELHCRPMAPADRTPCLPAVSGSSFPKGAPGPIQLEDQSRHYPLVDMDRICDPTRYSRTGTRASSPLLDSNTRPVSSHTHSHAGGRLPDPIGLPRPAPTQ